MAEVTDLFPCKPTAAPRELGSGSPCFSSGPHRCAPSSLPRREAQGRGSGRGARTKPQRLLRPPLEPRGLPGAGARLKRGGARPPPLRGRGPGRAEAMPPSPRGHHGDLPPHGATLARTPELSRDWLPVARGEAAGAADWLPAAQARGKMAAPARRSVVFVTGNAKKLEEVGGAVA